MSLKLLLLASRRYKRATIKGLINEAKDLFDEVVFAPINKLAIDIRNCELKLKYKGKPISNFDVCYPRFSAENFEFKSALLLALESFECYNPLNLRAYLVFNHKFFTTKKLAEASLPIIPSSLSVAADSSAKIIEKEFGFPVVVKLISGSAGKGIILVRDKKQLKSILDTVNLFQDVISAQQYSKSREDIRCYVIGEEVIAAKRTSPRVDFRANVSRGAKAELVEIPPLMENIALRAARLFDADICAVDFIRYGEDYAIIEINFMPGPFAKFLGNKILSKIVNYLHRRVSARIGDVIVSDMHRFIRKLKDIISKEVSN
ncbi:MAG: RimK family alpha-L-glutamate ligase [Candidatus Diapherotrites archaeon]|nr:RimK family alpha-L-glutamate ligase [Candidatus Diapherotrites archaeon]